MDDFEVASASPAASPATTESTTAKTSTQTNEHAEDTEAPNKDLSSQEADGDEGSEGTEDESSQDEGKPAKKKGGFQKRIERFQRQMSQKDQEIEHWKQEALKSKPHNEQAQAAQTTQQKPEGKPEPDNFDTHAEFVEALTDWKLEQKEKAAQAAKAQETAKSDFDSKIQAHQSRIEEFKKSQPDYEEVIGEFLEEHGDARFSPALEEIITTSDLGPAIVYELAKDKAEFDRINSLGPIAAAREIGKLEVKLTKSSDAPKETKNKTTKAPPPPKPISGSGKTEKSFDDMSFDEFLEARNAKNGRR